MTSPFTLSERVHAPLGAEGDRRGKCGRIVWVANRTYHRCIVALEASSVVRYVPTVDSSSVYRQRATAL
jgi:hypothetical protein